MAKWWRAMTRGISNWRIIVDMPSRINEPCFIYIYIDVKYIQVDVFEWKQVENKL